MTDSGTKQVDKVDDVESDASSLTDELGEIGLRTVDDDKLAVDVERVDIVDETTVRLWYDIPTVGLVPEEFEKPVPWNPSRYKLARLAEYNGIAPYSFTDFETDDDLNVVVEETESEPIGEEELERFQKACPGELGVEEKYTVTSNDVYQFAWSSTDPSDMDGGGEYGAEKSTDRSDTGSSKQRVSPKLAMIAGAILPVVIASISVVANLYSQFMALSSGMQKGVLLLVGGLFVFLMGIGFDTTTTRR